MDTDVNLEPLVQTPNPVLISLGQNSTIATVIFPKTTLTGNTLVVGTTASDSYLSPFSTTAIRSQTDQATAVARNAIIQPFTSETSLVSDIPLTSIKNPAAYFAGVYLPLMLSVLFRMQIGYLCTNIKMMEPFSMLSKPGGTAAKEFLWINYLSANYHLAPFQAMISGHLFMLWSSALYAGVLSASPLAAEVIGIYQNIYPTDIDTHIALAGPGKSFLRSRAFQSDCRQLYGYIQELLGFCRVF